MKPPKSLLSRLPGIRWTPSDIPSTSPSTSKPTKSRNPFSLKAAPPEHGTVRPRASTISLTSEPDVDIEARTHAQGQSDFFTRLPLELRQLVYEHVMGAEIVHLTLSTKKKRFGHFLCDSEGDGGREYMCRVLVFGKKGARLYPGGPTVLRACRRMYSEAISYLYRAHTFSLLHITHLLYLPASIPQPRLNSIRTLHLRWAIRALPYMSRGPSNRVVYRDDTANWEKAWTIIANMQGLRHLRVILMDPSPQWLWQSEWMELENMLLDSVRMVTKPRDAIVVLPYPSCRTDWDMGESTVKLRIFGNASDASEDTK
ncbi:hypothetical protein J4E83_009221 [Alternaria metachromatica]|uniref:uncharacterized protein n=1 Tax=Alternaria metachromatica TaxID=283354 RepID=UPI0020C1DA48|nr:uncharacterized protein J4E83_009221 [Alternaria metachromatica]XP_049244460.1 uncharacterized protein J4E84_004882 [Alternaria hordeiaustralica]KAI4608038.1 hypothetical protein J4E83_009221 [Alternaria metachromatica]KAI4687954.1 hypothetical protein J4E84_004882 [Alternaria hordeiaustralica]